MRKFLKHNWKACSFVPLIILANLTPKFFPENNIWWYEFSGSFTIFLLLVWLYIDSKRSEYEFSRFIILTGVVTSFKGVIDYAFTADYTNSIFAEIAIYVIIVAFAYYHYCRASANTPARHRR